MSQPIVRYNGDKITCYPGSNQTDDGKLNLEFNMARFITRLSSKNFCIVKPSFVLNLYTNQDTNLPQIEVDVGQCSINGMDLIMTERLYIDPPEGTGKFHLAFKLARDSSRNVLSDLVYGVTTTFEGVYLSWYDNKPDPVDPDMFYLGSVNWDGTRFTELVEDEDKYGRIWAEDVLGKFLDPKHPDERRLTLQEMIYNLPDWYLSKEGDTIYGPLIMADGRDNNNPGIIVNVDDNGSHITVKDPSVDNDKLIFFGDLNGDGVIDENDVTLLEQIISGEITPTDLQKELGDVNHDGLIDGKDLQYVLNFIAGEGNPGDTGNIYYIKESDKGINVDVADGNNKLNIGKAELSQSETDNVLHIHNPADICIDSEDDVKIEAQNNIIISTEDMGSPVLNVDDTSVSITDPNVPDSKFDFKFLDDNKTQFTLGKALWQYNETTRKVSLLPDNVSYLDIAPNADYQNDLRIQDTLYLGAQSSYGREQTYLRSTLWKLSEALSSPENYIEFKPNTITLTNPTGNRTSYITLTNKDKTQLTQIFDNGNIELTNPTTNLPKLTFKDGTASNTVSIEKVKDTNKLNITGNVNIKNNLVVEGTSSGNGLITTNGLLTFKNGTNDAQISKLANSNTLYTSSALKVGTSGSSNLYAGTTVINGHFYLGADSPELCELHIDEGGNLETKGTIRGSRVYGAVYNDFGEILEKAENEIIEYGDVVCVREDGLIHKVSSEEDVNRIIGICSDTMGSILGGENIPKEKQVEVGMLGLIWTKTNDTTIKPGDMVKVLSDGTVEATSYKSEKFAIAMSEVKNGKVRLFFK